MFKGDSHATQANEVRMTYVYSAFNSNVDGVHKRLEVNVGVTVRKGTRDIFLRYS